MRVSDILEAVQDAYNKLDEADSELRVLLGSIEDLQGQIRKAMSKLEEIPENPNEIDKDEVEE